MFKIPALIQSTPPDPLHPFRICHHFFPFFTAENYAVTGILGWWGSHGYKIIPGRIRQDPAGYLKKSITI
jgi:hypothetical protein